MTELATRVDESLAPQRRPRFARATFATAIVIWLVALLLWWASAQALRTSTPGIRGPLKVGESVHVGLTSMVLEEVTVVSVRPAVNGPISVQLQVCGGERDGSISSISGSEDLNDFCTSVTPLQRGTVLSPRVGPAVNGAYVIATVTQEGEGRAAFCGLEILYWSGWRVGWQRQVGESDFVTNPGGLPIESDRLCR